MKFFQLLKTLLEIIVFGIFWFIAKRFYKFSCWLVPVFCLFKLLVLYIILLWPDLSNPMDWTSSTLLDFFSVISGILVIKPWMWGWELAIWGGFNALVGLFFLWKNYTNKNNLKNIKPDISGAVSSFFILFIANAFLLTLYMDIREHFENPHSADLLNYIYFEFSILIGLTIYFFYSLIKKIPLATSLK